MDIVGQPLNRNRKRLVNEYLRAFFLAFLLAILIRHVLIEAYRIPSSSMEPTLKAGDYIFVNKASYGVSIPFMNAKLFQPDRPDRGDVVVFEIDSNPNQRFIKRVLAVPGDSILFNGKRWVLNGKPIGRQKLGALEYWDRETRERVRGTTEKHSIKEVSFEILKSYRMFPNRRQEWWGKVFKVPDGHVFVLSDNRNSGTDSRHYGYVPIANLKGRALFVSLSWDGHEQSFRWARFGKMIR